MWFPFELVLFTVVFAVLAARWGQAVQRSHRAAANKLGVEYRDKAATLSETARLYKVDGWLEQELERGLVDDAEADRLHRIARNRFRVLMTAVVFAAPASIISLVVDARSTVVPAIPAIPTTLATWSIAVVVASRILHEDAPADPRRVYRWLGLIAVAGGVALLVAIALVSVR